MKFTKMHGTGNDYIYINGFCEQIENPSEAAIRWSDRHKGIGSDGLVLILPSEMADFKMRMFNADGSESEMCGNASRCVGKYVFDKGMTDKTEITLETLAGIKRLQLFQGADGRISRATVDMGEPVLQTKAIPTTIEKEQLINETVKFNSGRAHSITTISMGNPHAVIFNNNIASLDLPKIGPEIENAAIFPNRVNTEFIEVVSYDKMKMRVWERGSGETLACGTGACAAAVAGVLNKLTFRKVDIELLGGTLTIEWKADDNHVYLTGDAVTVFEGEIEQ
jgi:diaminopimelate epimerase